MFTVQMRSSIVDDESVIVIEFIVGAVFCTVKQ